MSKAISTSKKNKLQPIYRSLAKKPCAKCGGNGYMKTTPNCYHTCLSCLGKGLVSDNNEKFN